MRRKDRNNQKAALAAFTILISLVLFYSLPQSCPAATGIFEFRRELLNRVQEKYGDRAVLRLQNLSKMIQAHAGDTEMEKVTYTNNFFNQIPYDTDIVHWKKKDYWATPFEKLTTFGGDCEDYAIAKYFTLRELNIPDSKLHIMYVKAVTFNEAHMVLTYFPHINDIPLVLDNINPLILPANKRKDLIPVYSFNAENLWLAKSMGTGKRVGGSGKLKLWKNLQDRMNNF